MVAQQYGRARAPVLDEGAAAVGEDDMTGAERGRGPDPVGDSVDAG